MIKQLLFILFFYLSLNCIAQSNVGFFGGYGKSRLYKFPFSGDVYKINNKLDDCYIFGINSNLSIDEKTDIFFDLFYKYYSLDIEIDKSSPRYTNIRYLMYSLPQLGVSTGYLFSIFKKNKLNFFLPFGFNLNYFFNSTFSGISYNTEALSVTAPDGTMYYVFVNKITEHSDEKATNIRKLQLSIISGINSRINLNKNLDLIIYPMFNLGVSKFIDDFDNIAPMNVTINFGINYYIE